jgi:histidinol phosphatase-like PHP family hydrolase/predicted nuclease with RNAse H fold/dephospho-CoA kinase
MPENSNLLEFVFSQSDAGSIVGSPSPSARVAIDNDYFRLRDFEYAQPLYDLAYFLETDATSKGQEVPKYRTFSLWRAAYSFDGYSTALDKWLDREIGDDCLDYVPSSRIAAYLLAIRQLGTIPELKSYSSKEFDRLRRLRAVKGLGFAQAAETLKEGEMPSERWLNAAIISTKLAKNALLDVYVGTFGTWQAAHIVPPLARLLREFESQSIDNSVCHIDSDLNGIAPVSQPFAVDVCSSSPREYVEAALSKQPLFTLKAQQPDSILIQHQLGWYFKLRFVPAKTDFDLFNWAVKTDPLIHKASLVKADLHLHTAWSDGNASLSSMATAIKNSGLTHFAVTDHSRSCKLQGGLTPVLWLRQAASIALNRVTCPIFHGIEVDILDDGRLDLPVGLLSGMDLVVGSVHSNWTSDEQVNTQRLSNAIETGLIDILGHPTSALIGKPGVPNYVRPPAKVNWEHIFSLCAKWKVALELNCFPSRLDLPLTMLTRAVDAGCWVSLGSDAHSRTHLTNLRFGELILVSLRTNRVLNLLKVDELKDWLRSVREVRANLPKTTSQRSQGDLFVESGRANNRPKIRAYLNPPQRIPLGSRIVGLDLTAGKGKPTGVALLEGMEVSTCSLETDAELISFILAEKPAIVSIDSPLGYPGGGSEIDPSVGIVRVAEHDLSSVGIPAYPALIDSMKELTSRGVRLRRIIEGLEDPPIVIESYPGAAQDVLCIPRKQKSLELLRGGLQELGITGKGLQTESHDEMDAITSAVVGRFHETGEFLPMGVPSEAQLIVPRIKPLCFDINPIICLAGKTGAGKSVVARYLALFYGFRWLKTRDLIRELLVEDFSSAESHRLYEKRVEPNAITDNDLREFGVVVLEKHRQKPLSRKLSSAMNAIGDALVVDSIRDLTDLGGCNTNRPIYTWLIDCSDAMINNRLVEKSKIPSFKGRPIRHGIDQKVSVFRDGCDCTIVNMGTLEDLRWKIDDALFEVISFSNTTAMV